MKNNNQPAIERLRIIAHNLDYERESILTDIPSVNALIEYYDLWSVYDTEYWEGMVEAIADGDDPKPLQGFIKKYGLGWVIPQDVLDLNRDTALVRTELGKVGAP